MQDENAEEGAHDLFGKIGSGHKKITRQEVIDSVRNEIDRLNDAFLKQVLTLVKKEGPKMEIESQRLQGPKYHQCPPSKEAKAFICDPGNGWDLSLCDHVVLEGFKFCPYCGVELET